MGDQQEKVQFADARDSNGVGDEVLPRIDRMPLGTITSPLDFHVGLRTLKAVLPSISHGLASIMIRVQDMDREQCST